MSAISCNTPSPCPTLITVYLVDPFVYPNFSHFQTLSCAILFPAMDPAHNFGQIRLHVSRALFHLNHLASLIPFCVIDEDAPDPPPVSSGRHLVRWSAMGPPSPPPPPPTSSSSRTNFLITHGQLPSSMVLNPEPHFRPISVRQHLEAESSNPRGRQSVSRVPHPPITPATASEDPIPMAAPRPAKRPRTTPSAPTGDHPRHSVPSEALPIPDDDDVHVTPTNPTTLPVRSEDSGSEDAHAASMPHDHPHEEPPASAPAAPEAPPPAPRIGHTIRGWAQIDDTELISLKQDARARHSWKAIGQRLHRDPDSCKARWYWLKSSRPELSAPAAETED